MLGRPSRLRSEGCEDEKMTAWRVAFSRGRESKRPWHEYRPSKTTDLKKPVPGRSIGSAGGHICPSGNGARCARITARTVPRGSTFLTTMRAREHIDGAKTASEASATGIR